MIYPALRTWIHIDRHAFNRNITAHHAMVAPHNATIAVVVKSNAYGHGMKEIAHLCQEHEQVAYLCVASLSEAIQLRLQGITKPLLVLGILDSDPSEAIKQNIELAVYDYETAEALNHYAQQCNVKCAIHIKIDTGLSRLGFLPEQALDAVKALQQLQYITIRGIYSHFAESNNEDLAFTNQQLQRFQAVLQTLADHNITIPVSHIANSAGVSAVSLHGLSMVRMGAGAYGMIPSAISAERSCEKNTYFFSQPILRWCTRIMHIRTIPAGEPIGYDRTFVTSRETKIALLPIGYADGYNRRLSNKGVVLLAKSGHYAPVIGRVAMNITTIDITDIPEVTTGDEVVLVGHKQAISPNALADLTEGFNPREITTQINPEIPRIIV